MPPTPRPVALDYGSSPAGSGVARVLPSVVVATLCFAAGHLLVESVTGYLAAFEFGWLGPASDARQITKLHDKYDLNMITEVVWTVPAAFVVLVVQLGLVAYWRGRRRRGTWAFGLAASVCYCWAGWGVWGLSRWLALTFPESANFASAMLLAVAAGVALGVCGRASTG